MVYAIGREKPGSGPWYACEVQGGKKIPVCGPYTSQEAATKAEMALRSGFSQADANEYAMQVEAERPGRN